MTITNAKDEILAQLFSIADEETMVSIETRKQGVWRGKGIKRVYNNSKIRVLIWVGWDYQEIVQTSLNYFQSLRKEGFLVEDTLYHARKEGYDLSKKTVQDGIYCIQDSLYRRLRGEEGPAANPRKRWAEQVPLEIDGKVIRGVKVYKGPDRRFENPRSPKPNQITVHGLKLGEVILEKPPNGHYKVNSKDITIAKKLITRRLLIGRYVSYVCKPTAHVAIGQKAVQFAEKNNLKVDSSAVLALFKLSKLPPRPAPVYPTDFWI
jgi:hypothetical protein